jgi:hypothetical protein
MLLLVTELESALSVFRQRKKTSMRSISVDMTFDCDIFGGVLKVQMGLSALEIRCELECSPTLIVVTRRKF